MAGERRFIRALGGRTLIAVFCLLLPAGEAPVPFKIATVKLAALVLTLTGIGFRCPADRPRQPLGVLLSSRSSMALTRVCQSSLLT